MTTVRPHLAVHVGKANQTQLRRPPAARTVNFQKQKKTLKHETAADRLKADQDKFGKLSDKTAIFKGEATPVKKPEPSAPATVGRLSNGRSKVNRHGTLVPGKLVIG